MFEQIPVILRCRVCLGGSVAIIFQAPRCWGGVQVRNPQLVERFLNNVAIKRIKA